MKRIVLATGGFDPAHTGHIAYLRDAKFFGDILLVGVNSDLWLTRKKGQAFLPSHERLVIVENLKPVDGALLFDDDDGSARDAIRKVRSMYPDDRIIFVNGGDRTSENIPEMDVEDDNIEFVFNVGGDFKMNSSSWILNEWRAPKTNRNWGYYRVLHQVDGTKVKELTINPGQSLSMQRHQLRSEYWLVSNGSCIVNSTTPDGYALPPTTLVEHSEYKVPVGEWHQLTNPFEVPCKIVEIQYGEKCDEEDIERK